MKPLKIKKKKSMSHNYPEQLFICYEKKYFKLKLSLMDLP